MSISSLAAGEVDCNEADIVIDIEQIFFPSDSSRQQLLSAVVSMVEHRFDIVLAGPSGSRIENLGIAS